MRCVGKEKCAQDVGLDMSVSSALIGCSRSDRYKWLGLGITFGGTCQWLQLQCVSSVVACELPAADCVCLAGVEILRHRQYQFLNYYYYYYLL
jgi:hypothetical protein